MTRPLLLPLALSLLVGCAANNPPPEDNDEGGSGGVADGGQSGSGTGGKGTGGADRATGGTGGMSASGGLGGGTTATGGTGGSGAGGSDAGTVAPDTGGGGEPGTGGPAAALDKFVFDVPCPMGTVKAAGNCTVSDAAARKKTKTIQFGGNPATTYKVKLHVCAPAEGRGYTGCATGPESKIVCLDGMPQAGQYQVTYPTYSLAVSAPMHKYWLNNQYKADDIQKIEYSSTFEIQGGAMLTFETDGGSNPDVYTADYKKHNLQCPGAPGIMQPFAGQFLYFTVESITPME